MLDNIKVLYHSSIKISKDKIIYIDPFKIDQNYNDADIIFITHNHYDHFSKEDIQKVSKYNTKFVIPNNLINKLLILNYPKENILGVLPNQTYQIQNINFETIPAYNLNKSFHLKENNWLGYNIEINNIKYYIAGDTDITEENKKVKCDVAFVPVGGTYTMNYKEAAMLVNIIKPKIAIPIHYGDIVGTKTDAINFIKLLNPKIKGIILM